MILFLIILCRRLKMFASCLLNIMNTIIPLVKNAAFLFSVDNILFFVFIPLKSVSFLKSWSVFWTKQTVTLTYFYTLVQLISLAQITTLQNLVLQSLNFFYFFLIVISNNVFPNWWWVLRALTRIYDFALFIIIEWVRIILSLIIMIILAVIIMN